jgi:Stage II sporulation protein E (SpoIIE)
MTGPRRVSKFGIGALFAAGALLAVALLAQTVINYQYVSTNLLRQEARRVAAERVRNVERAVRLARPESAAAFGPILDDVRSDLDDQVAALALVQNDGTVVATSGPIEPALAPEERARFLADRNAPFTRIVEGDRDVLVGVFTCRCNLPRRTPGTADQAGTGGRLLLQVGLYRDSLSAPFARLRRDAILSASAALALFVSVSLIAARFGPYVQGKQLEAQADLARQVQRDLLPGRAAWPSGIDVAADCLPASQVGGDFYDIVSLPGDRVAFTLGDVSGHGLAAALLMGLIHGAMSSPPWGSSDEDPDRAATRLNHLLVTKSSGERFASLFWCAYDPEAGRLRYVNAGHPPPVFIRRAPDGVTVVERLADGGPVLGLLAGAEYRTVSVEAREGDLLVLFSDGVDEAANRRRQPFGEERLIAAARGAGDRPAREVADAILSAVRSFTGDATAEDDQTLLVVRLWRTPGGATT